jgi:hypothetical protein
MVLTLVSPEGGPPPVDPRSERPEVETAATIRFQRDSDAQAELANTRRLSSISAATMMPPSTQVATARCGISPMTRTQSR